MTASTPIATVRAALKTLFTGQYTGYTLYDYFPTSGVSIPCIVIQHVSGSESEAAGGQNVSASEKGRDLRLRFQVDVYDKTHSAMEVTADLVLERIFENLAVLKASDSITNIVPIVVTDVGSDVVGAREYRKMIDLECFVQRIKS